MMWLLLLTHSSHQIVVNLNFDMHTEHVLIPYIGFHVYDVVDNFLIIYSDSDSDCLSF